MLEKDEGIKGSQQLGHNRVSCWLVVSAFAVGAAGSAGQTTPVILGQEIATCAEQADDRQRWTTAIPR